ncbi:MAG: peptidoglycan DD-metalloendopeptidase family protein [Myxococcales bacterium]|nr:peptidoglycan DD-metalloendopeptidase family protein [Myxococcales bacterium]
MMIYRIPVVGAALPPPLRCIDLDPTTGRRKGSRICQEAQQRHTGGNFSCPGGCNKAAFLYPRKWRKNGKDFHFHQGIDIGREPYIAIRSVTGGTAVVVLREYRSGWSNYGKLVVVDADDFPYFFLYAHCDSISEDVFEGARIAEGQVIAKVGNTFYNSNNPVATFSSPPHLHFEVLTSLKPGIRGKETQLGEDRTRDGSLEQPRLDPLHILEMLGPWGMKAVFRPQGDEMIADDLSGYHEEVEESPHGGFFPLGANNHWHGGVHLPTIAGTNLVAPFDATIVAARLDPDPKSAIAFEGSLNFILLRHEVSPAHYEMFRRNDPEWVEPTPPAKAKDRAVGLKSRCANEPEDVKAVKRKLWEHRRDDGQPFYDPGWDGGTEPPDLQEGTIRGNLRKVLKRAIMDFQGQRVPKIVREDGSVSTLKPDGVVDIPGRTWTALHDGSPPTEPTSPDPESPAEPDAPSSPTTDPKRTLYCLLMHLQPLAITNALAERFEWLSRVRLTPEPEPSAPPKEDDEAEDEAEQQREDDLAEAKGHTITAAVGAPSKDGDPAANLVDDVTWVHQRLIRFGYAEGPPSSLCSEPLIDAIRRFQNAHHKSFKTTGKGDGRVDVKGDTVTKLRMTKAELERTKAKGGKGKPSKPTVDPALAALARERHADGLAKVMVGLDVKVSSGETLWPSGQARGYSLDDGSLPMLDQIHWEIFSEHLLVTDWDDPIEDTDDDLRADLPKKLVEWVELDSPQLHKDGLLSTEEVRSFYRTRGELVRRTPCRFTNHWGLDVDKAVVRLEQMGYDTTGLADQLRPMMWWDEAAEVLPPTKLVWHYNPVELLGQYARYLEELRPIEPGDPATEPTLVVWVYYADGQPMPDMAVDLLDGIQVVRTVSTRPDGSAWFHAVPLGTYGVLAKDPGHELHEAVVVAMPSADEHNELEIYTEVPGPPLERGTIEVQVRKYTGTIAGSGIEVWLEHDEVGPVTNGYTEHGKVRFEDIVHGAYTLRADRAEPVSVVLDRKMRRAPTIKLPRPILPLRMRVSIDGAPGAGLEVVITRKEEEIARGLTHADGVADFDVPAGHYRASVGGHGRSVSAREDVVNDFALKIRSKDGPVPMPPDGTLIVSVSRHEDDEPRRGAWVSVADDGRGIFELANTDDDGDATFELPPGDYLVDAEGADSSWLARVEAAAVCALSIEVDE